MPKLKIKKLEALRKKCVYAALPWKKSLRKFYSSTQGLDFDTLLALVGIISSHGYQELQETLHQYPILKNYRTGSGVVIRPCGRPIKAGISSPGSCHSWTGSPAGSAAMEERGLA